MKKVLIAYVPVGGGHQKAAEALYDYGKTLPGIDLRIVNSLEYTLPLHALVYSRVYDFLVIKTPKLWGFLYWFFNQPLIRPIIRAVRRFNHSVYARGFKKFLIKENFDYVISTHFLSSEIAAYLKRKGKIKTKSICVITDFEPHSMWWAKGTDFYCVATEMTRKRFSRFNMGKSKILATGIPVHKKFFEKKDPVQLKRKLGLNQKDLTVMIATGSFGTGPIEKIIQSLKEVQMVVVCGNNQPLYERLNRRKQKKVEVFGFVDNMDELMNVADVIITKPGGLSISEALVSELPMIFFNEIPGQEKGNVKVLKRYGVGKRAVSIKGIVRLVAKFKDSSDKFLVMKKQAKRLSRPAAVKDVFELTKR